MATSQKQARAAERAARRSKPKGLRRTTGTRPEKKTIVVFCEGENSEPDYVNGLKRLPDVERNTSIEIEIDPAHGVPLTLIQKAVGRKDSDPEVDEVWCIFDVEWPQHHPHLKEAVAQGRSHGIRLAISNPCFEIWLILHLKDHTGFLNTAPAVVMSCQLDGRSGKHIDPAIYLPKRHQAARRAVALARRHEGNGAAFPHDNPSSTMHEFLAAVAPSKPS